MTIVLSISAFKEVILMEEPMITNYSRPLTPNDREELGPFHFADYNYVIAVDFIATNYKKNKIAVPPEYG